MLISSCFEDDEVDIQEKKAKLTKEKEYGYFHFEDELMKKVLSLLFFYSQYASLTFMFEVNQLGDDTLSESLKQFREVMIVPFSCFPSIVKDIENIVQQSFVCSNNIY